MNIANLSNIFKDYLVFVAASILAKNYMTKKIKRKTIS